MKIREKKYKIGVNRKDLPRFLYVLLIRSYSATAAWAAAKRAIGTRKGEQLT